MAWLSAGMSLLSLASATNLAHGGRRVLLRGGTQWFEGMAGSKLWKRGVVLAGHGLCGEPWGKRDDKDLGDTDARFPKKGGGDSLLNCFSIYIPFFFPSKMQAGLSLSQKLLYECFLWKILNICHRIPDWFGVAGTSKPISFYLLP